ncbi:amidase family protein [Streptomyces sp. NBC_01236]|uniref:amidase family protein n=1 Tax=Streptomyces sp. NBC_01236 TaxID=2903789 RepID=UPI003FA3C74E
MAFDPVGGPHPQRPGYRRWADMDLACPGAQVRDARDLAPILASTTGPMARDGGFSYALAPPRARRLSDFRVAVWYDDPSCPIDTDVSGAIQDVIAVLRAGGAKVTIEPTSLPCQHRDTAPGVRTARLRRVRGRPHRNHTEVRGRTGRPRAPPSAQGCPCHAPRDLPVALLVAQGGRGSS